MRLFSKGITTIEISDDCLRGLESRLIGSKTRMEAEFSRQLDSKEFLANCCTIYSLILSIQMVKEGLDAPGKIRVLYAHGYVDSDRWFYVEKSPRRKRKDLLLERWLDRHETCNDLLVIIACNTEGVAIQARKCAILYPLGRTNPSDVLENYFDRRGFAEYRFQKPQSA